MRFCDFQIGVTLLSTERAVAVDDINSALDPMLQARQVFKRPDVPEISNTQSCLRSSSTASASQRLATHPCCGCTLSGFVCRKWGGKTESLRPPRADLQYTSRLREMLQ
jgi:hypothetical protein